MSHMHVGGRLDQGTCCHGPYSVRASPSSQTSPASLLTGEEGWRVMTEGWEQWQLALSEGSSAPWGGQLASGRLPRS